VIAAAVTEIVFQFGLIADVADVSREYGFPDESEYNASLTFPLRAVLL
jgi:hypothetical protein